MSFFSYALGALVLVVVLLRQVQVRPVRRMYQPRFPLFLGVIGLFAMLSYAGDHHVSGSAWGWVIGTLVVGAVGLGALRGLSMRVWSTNGWVVRQGNAVTMALWLVSLLVHFAGDAGGDHAGSVGLVGASFLLYLGLTLAVQGSVVHHRAMLQWEKLGPDAGRPLRINFSQGPETFFAATFRSPGAGPAGWAPTGPGPAGWGPDPSDDPNVIDAEVVEDDDEPGPPELHAPR